MYATSHQPMRPAILVPRQRTGEPREMGCIRRQPAGRSTARRAAIAESAGVR